MRPGPIQGGAVHPYLERRERLRKDPSFRVPYDHPSLEPILRDTLGTIVFQEQVIQVAMALAGFSAGEAEGLRRAMSRKRSEEAILAYRDQFIAGARERGAAPEVAERVFEQIRGFSGFGFPKAHAVAFGLLAYQSTWLRVHYAPEFLCSLLNEQPMGFYPPDALVHEAQRRGIEVLAPDVNRSGVECTVEIAQPHAGPGGAPRQASHLPNSVRIGLGYITGLRDDEARRWWQSASAAAPTRASPTWPRGPGLAATGSSCWRGRGRARRSAGGDALRRREDLWRLGVAQGGRRSGGGERDRACARPALPPPPHSSGALAARARFVGAAGRRLRVDGDRDRRAPDGAAAAEPRAAVSSSAGLDGIADGGAVEVAGMVVARQRPATARGVVFMLLEDELGTINVVVPPPVYARHRLAVRTASFARVSGKLERRAGVVNVVASACVRSPRPTSRAPTSGRSSRPSERETGRRATAGERSVGGCPRGGARRRRAGRPQLRQAWDGEAAQAREMQVPLQGRTYVRPRP